MGLTAAVHSNTLRFLVVFFNYFLKKKREQRLTINTTAIKQEWFFCLLKNWKHHQTSELFYCTLELYGHGTEVKVIYLLELRGETLLVFQPYADILKPPCALALKACTCQFSIWNLTNSLTMPRSDPVGRRKSIIDFHLVKVEESPDSGGE